jgi:metallophosphoesterase (TIGR00282 family)
VKWLILGDVVSSPGRSAVRDYLKSRADQYDMVVANGENAAGGMGITFDIVEELLSYGVDVITGGNHTWKKKDFVQEWSSQPDRYPILRPLNYPGEPPGQGYLTTQVNRRTVLVLNLQGRTFMDSIDCPFRAADECLDRVDYDLALVDFHAEATSEKIAMGKYLDGRVSTVVGTHTHVQTADARVLEGGTAYVTDLGMTGPKNSILGVRDELATERFLTGRPVSFKVEKQGPRIVNGLSVTIDIEAGKADHAERINEELPERTH